MGNSSESSWAHVSNASSAGGFGERLPPEGMLEFDSLRTESDCVPGTVLFIERQLPKEVNFLLAGQVKLSMNSRAGRRVILGIAYAGETLGLASIISGNRYDVTAEAASPCSVATIVRKDFLEFLRRYPSAYANVARELSLEAARACRQVRRIGLTVTASARLVRFLLDQCALAQMTDGGARLFCALTHEEIGECIGVSRETVTRLFSDFKCQELLESRGSNLIISDRRALELYAGVD